MRESWQMRWWMRFGILVVLFFGALFLMVISGPKSETDAAVTLGSFYQREGFLVAIVRDRPNRNNSDLARKLISARYVPVANFDASMPFDAIVGVTGDAISVMPGPFFCRDGRYAESDLPIFQAKDTADALRYIEAIARAQEKICAPPVGSSRKYI